MTTEAGVILPLTKTQAMVRAVKLAEKRPSTLVWVYPTYDKKRNEEWHYTASVDEFRTIPLRTSYIELYHKVKELPER